MVNITMEQYEQDKLLFEASEVNIGPVFFRNGQFTTHCRAEGISRRHSISYVEALVITFV